MAKRLLVVDDDDEIRELLEFDLSHSGYSVDTACDGMDGLNKAVTNSYDLVLLDVMMPKMNGFDVCKNLRKAKPDIPVLLLTAKGTITDKTQGFDCGADDYLVKPFDIQEVLLRVKALLRRNTDNSSKDEQSFKQEILKMGDIELFPESLETGIEGKRIKLTPTEFEILYCLMQHFNDSVSLAVLLDEVWGYDSDEDVRMVRVHVGGLRQKIEADTKNPKYLHTVTNVGYKLTPITNTTDNGQE
ncbi:MAG TPA: response regulator transcription factor [Candidatus Limenecus avicola]|jgi:two-component response regulator involved in phosphate regulation|uniref:Stage 0 sporulation protein A homolog n=1 Tax=Candidatus Limenecus avicola TaxID=2840847 RepID=A0A9D1MZD6_9CLOT|nr:response regulator transcription factor [Clostridium sp.]CDC18468.1 two-component response regulator [Clostridium sp. CAG:306]HIU92249.1 response regulator transcription factor [Candidatus Limenecus avicola]